MTMKCGRRIVLTEAGRALAEAGVGVGAAMQQVESVLDQYRSERTATLRVGFFASGAEMLLPRVMLWLSEHAPGVRLKAHFVEPAGSEAAALTGDYDLVVGHSFNGAQVWHGQAEIVPLLREPLDVAVPNSHPLATYRTVSAEDVAQFDWIGVPDDYPFHSVLSAIETRSGRQLNVVQRFPDLRVIEALVEAGVGLGVLARFTAQSGNGIRFGLKPLNDVESARTIAALVRPDRLKSPAIQTVIEALLAAAKQIEIESVPLAGLTHREVAG